MISFFYKTIKEPALRKLDRPRAGVWVDAENPSETEIEFLVGLGLDRGLLADAMDVREVPRLETKKGVTYIFTRVPAAGGDMPTIPLLVAIAEKFVLTLGVERAKALSTFRANKIEFYTTQKTKFLIQIFSSVNKEFNASITEISRKVRGVKINMEKIKNKDLVQLVNFEESLNDFLSALVPTSALLRKMLAGGHIALYTEDKDVVENLFLESNQLIEFCKSTLKTIVNIRDAYSTIMTHNLNRVIKLLTALTIILTIPTVISSIFGMNVRLPMQDSPLAFSWVMALTAAVSVFTLGVFAKKGWL